MNQVIDGIVKLFKGHEGAVAPQVLEAPDGSGDQVVALREDNDDGGSSWSLERIPGQRQPRLNHRLRSLSSFLEFAKKAQSVYVDFNEELGCAAYTDEEDLHSDVVFFASAVTDVSAWWLKTNGQSLSQEAAVRSMLLFGDAIRTEKQPIMAAISSLGAKATGEASTQVDGTGNQRIAIQHGQEETIVRVPERIEIELATEDPDCPKGVFPVYPYVQASQRVVTFSAVGVSAAKLAVARELAAHIRTAVGDKVAVYVGAPVVKERPVPPVVMTGSVVE